MKFWRTVCLLTTGGVIENLTIPGPDSVHQDLYIWVLLAVVSASGWFWSALGQAILRIFQKLAYRLAGRPQPRRTDDPQALAAEITALQAQIAQLRETATSFDVSFDDTLQRLDQRLQRLEQQSAYVTIRG